LTKVFFLRYLSFTGPLRGAHKPHPKVNGFFPGGRGTPEVLRVKKLPQKIAVERMGNANHGWKGRREV